MNLPPSASDDGMPMPPYSLGDPLSSTAAEGSTEALRKVLVRHRRHQFQVGGAVLVVALVAGSLAGFAVGRQGRGAGVTHLAAGNQTPTKSNAAVGAPGEASNSNSSSSAIAVAPMKSQSTQLLVRNAKNGVRVRLYEETFPQPQPVSPPTCPARPNTACPEIAVPPSIPNKVLLAEVSDDQVAGQAVIPVSQNLKASGFDPLHALVVGGGQPQPILVVLGHAGSGVSTVEVTTPYGSDSAAPGAGGWVALAVQLPANYQPATDSGPSGSMGTVPTGTVTAHSPSGAAVDSIALSKLESQMFSNSGCGASAKTATPVPSVATTEAGAKSAGGGSAAGAAPGSPPNAMICDASGTGGSASTSSGSTSSGSTSSGSSGPAITTVVPAAP
jgi:hypothetical protein